MSGCWYVSLGIVAVFAALIAAVVWAVRYESKRIDGIDSDDYHGF